MEYESVLLIGGPKDGQWISILKGMPSIRMPTIPVRTSYLGDSEAMGGPIRLVKDVTYNRYLIQSSQGLKTAVYVVDGLDPLVALINGYRPSVIDRRS